MAHVVLKPKASGGAVLIVDGIDLSAIARRDEFKIETIDDRWVVTLTIAATEGEIDLPDAVVIASMSEGED